MEDERTYFVLCADNCRFEGMTKEQILAAITQAVESGEIKDVDTGFVTKLKEKNGNRQVTVWVGTQAQYNALETPEENCLYIITDDTTVEDIEREIEALRNELQECAESTETLQGQFESHLEETSVFDVSDSVNLAIGSPTDASVVAISKKYTWAKGLGIVFFNLSIILNLPTATLDVSIQHTLDFFSDRGNEPASAIVYTQTDNKTYSAISYYGVNDDETCSLEIKFPSAISGTAVISVSGWYYCRRATDE